MSKQLFFNDSAVVKKIKSQAGSGKSLDPEPDAEPYSDIGSGSELAKCCARTVGSEYNKIDSSGKRV